MKQIGRNGDIAFFGIEIAHFANMAIHAEDFLKHDHGRPVAGFRQGAIGAETAAVGGVDLDSVGGHNYCLAHTTMAHYRAAIDAGQPSFQSY